MGKVQPLFLGLASAQGNLCKDQKPYSGRTESFMPPVFPEGARGPQTGAASGVENMVE